MFKYSQLFLVAVFAILVQTLYLKAELKLSNWQTYTSLVNVKDMTFDGENTLWFATTGGVFSYNIENDEINEYRNTEGLMSLKTSSISYNREDKKLYIGTEDGYLHIIDSSNNWTYITDIVTAKYSNPEIRKILFYKNKAILCGGFGITIFDTEQNVFDETVSRFSDMQSEPVINDILIDKDMIWSSTSEGVVKADLKKSIANPKAWE